MLITYLEFTVKKCKDKNCKLECEFIGFKNDRLHYRRKECKKDVLSQKMV